MLRAPAIPFSRSTRNETEAQTRGKCKVITARSIPEQVSERSEADDSGAFKIYFPLKEIPQCENLTSANNVRQTSSSAGECGAQMSTLGLPLNVPAQVNHMLSPFSGEC